MNMNNNADTQKAADATKNLVNNAADSAKEGVNSAAETAKEGVNATRKAATEAADKVQEGLESAQKQVAPVIDDLAARAQELASRSIHFCADTSERARQQLQCAAEATNRYVVEQPAKSLVMAAAAGAAIATAFMWGSRSRR
ncbi:hypothetical protein [Comamonas endophytica]|uniref:ElaB/YqjD/DUF883 family membrane-anchored ribosome-binding protein n=1 Tax=Comamonas endophytica TaxID=2949090 RepID=A0ABY6G6S0_9BURK|nr:MULTISPECIES: hypothetical protein [unclassified Acidovorax]MCD2511334.1 hypothetical protein [Acidovorax sp. D4N7]UYG50728.1 hypothetical protein M9799_11555 [Acidovorax sp. 5MLIR]